MRADVDVDDVVQEVFLRIQRGLGALRDDERFGPWAALPSPYRGALTLTELEGLTQKDAAAMLGISLSGMKSRVQRGRQKLRQAFDACCRIAVDARGHVLSCERRAAGESPHGCCA